MIQINVFYLLLKKRKMKAKLKTSKGSYMEGKDRKAGEWKLDF